MDPLSSNTILRTPHVAPNFCSRSDPLCNERHQSSGILTWNWQQKAFLGCTIITPKNPLFRYYSSTVMSLKYWFQSTMECSIPICNSCWASATLPLTFQHHCTTDRWSQVFSKKAIVPDANSLLTNLYWATPGNVINCIIQSLLSTVAIASWENFLRSKQSILSTPSYAFLTVVDKASPNSHSRYIIKNSLIRFKCNSMMTEYTKNYISK